MTVHKARLAHEAGSLVLLLGISVTNGDAQARAVDPEQRRAAAESACRSSVPQLMASSVVAERSQGLAEAAACPDAGPDLLAGWWQNASTDQALLFQAVFSSNHLIDGRIAEALLAAVMNRSGNRVIRYAALSALTTQLNPEWEITFYSIGRNQAVPFDSTRAAPPEDHLTTGVARIRLGQTRGRIAISPALTSRVQRELHQLYRETDDRYLRLAIAAALPVMKLEPVK